ncbi:MAG: sensor histidine kinase [Paracoccaceae bacterium]
MSDLTTALPTIGPRWLRLPGWRRLVVASCLAGAAAILAATYSLVGAREEGRLAAAAEADARVLAAALADDVDRVRPLVVLLAGDPVLVAFARAPEARGLRAAAATRLDELLGLLHLDGAVVRPADGAPLAAGTALPSPAADAGTLAAVAGPQGLARLEGAARFGGGVGRLGLSLRPAALPHAWARITGEAVVTDAEGSVVASTRPAWQGRRLDDLAAPGDEGAPAEPEDEGALRIAGTRYRHESVAVGRLGLDVHVLSPTAIVGARTREVMGLEIMVMSLLAALAGFMDSRASRHAYASLSDDAEALRTLNARLEAEMAERRRVEAELEQASKLAALGQMSAAVAHELAQPLAAMRTYLAGARLLVRSGRAAEAGESYERVEALAERMGAITRELKAFARRGGDPAGVVDLRETVRGAMAAAAPALEAVDATLCLDLGAVPSTARADRHRLEQILTNLLRNAADAVRERPVRRVHVVVRADETTVRVVVEDTGPGVAVEERARVFEPFHTTKPAGEGLGLGLAIAAGIAEHLGGRLSLGEGEAGGARFVLALPRAEAMSLDAPASGARPRGARADAARPRGAPADGATA